MDRFTKLRRFVRRRGGLPYLIKLAFNGNNGVVASVGEFTQGVVGDRPTRVNNALVFTANTEWLTSSNAYIAGIANSSVSNFGVDLRFSLSNLGLNHTIVSWGNNANNNPAMLIGVSNANKIRIQRRDNTLLTKTLDIQSPILAANTEYTLTTYFSGGNVSVWLDGIFISNSVDYVTTTSNNLPFNIFSIGARVQSSATLPLVGTVSEVRIYE